ncbi:MAG: mechanosensitive ion channel family protein [Janthinobacterium lividum]
MPASGAGTQASPQISPSPTLNSGPQTPSLKSQITPLPVPVALPGSALLAGAGVTGVTGTTGSAAPVSRSLPTNVVLADEVVFPIATNLGQFSSADRALVTSQRITQLANDSAWKPDSIRTVERGGSTDVVSGDMLLTTVTDQDAFFDPLGRTRQALAGAHAQSIRDAIQKENAEFSVASLSIGALKAGAAALVLLCILLGLRYTFPSIYRGIHGRRGTHIRTIRIQSVVVLSEERITEILVLAARLFRFALSLLLFYFFIPLVFSFFAPTRRFGHTLIEYVLSPLHRGWSGLVAYLPSLLVVLIVFFFTFQALRLTRFIFKEVERGTIVWPGFYAEWAMPTSRIVDLLLVALGVVIAFPYLPGSDSAAFKGVSIFLGVLLSLGSSTAIANVVAGVLLTYTRAFRLGDRVQIADTVGDVIEKTLLATHIRTSKNVNVTVPNGLVLASQITNYSRSTPDKPLILATRMTVGYDVPWRKVHELLIAAAEATMGVLARPKPFVLQTSLDDFSVSYQINAYTSFPQRMEEMYSELNEHILDRFNEARIEILSPQYTVWQNSNNRPVPEEYQVRPVQL